MLNAESKSLTILDGGMSRELMRIDAPFQQPEWSAYALMQAPHLVQQIHNEFAAAGADILTTNSYALVPFHIGEDRFWSQAEQLAALAGQLARAAADMESTKSGRKVLVAGSLPPIFGSYEPGLFDEAKVQDYLSVLVRGLSPYIDIWLGETLSLIAEAKAVRTAVKGTSKPFWISFTINDHEQKPSACLRSGESVTDAARWCVVSDVEGLLFNCSRPEFMSTAIREARAVISQQSHSIPIGVYANAFVPNSESYAANEDVSAIRKDLTTKAYISIAHEWVAEGATIIGGCCGIGCEHIKRLAQEMKDGKPPINIRREEHTKV